LHALTGGLTKGWSESRNGRGDSFAASSPHPVPLPQHALRTKSIEMEDLSAQRMPGERGHAVANFVPAHPHRPPNSRHSGRRSGKSATAFPSSTRKSPPGAIRLAEQRRFCRHCSTWRKPARRAWTARYQSWWRAPAAVVRCGRSTRSIGRSVAAIERSMQRPQRYLRRCPQQRGVVSGEYSLCQ
jgi:hypothetical protein